MGPPPQPHLTPSSTPFLLSQLLWGQGKKVPLRDVEKPLYHKFHTFPSVIGCHGPREG